jgi:hypothetical protein
MLELQLFFIWLYVNIRGYVPLAEMLREDDRRRQEEADEKRRQDEPDVHIEPCRPLEASPLAAHTPPPPARYADHAHYKKADPPNKGPRPFFSDLADPPFYNEHGRRIERGEEGYVPLDAGMLELQLFFIWLYVNIRFILTSLLISFFLAASVDAES